MEKTIDEYKRLVNDEITKYFGGDFYRYFIYLRSYSRYRDDLNRRELWSETIKRFLYFMKENLGNKLSKDEYQEIYDSILYQRVMPSMRLLWASGESVRKNPACGYNCSYTVVDNLKRFREIMFLLMSGCGVGFSVENKFISNLPIIEKQTGNKLPIFVIDDSREGWADSLHHGITNWFDGNDVDFDFSQIRPLGSRLKTFGGRSSGPTPLRDCLTFVRKVILGAQGRKLRSIECHDIATKIAEVVVSGGTRRSSEISYSDLHDEEMRNAKFGNFYEKYGHRVMANNSVAYNTKPTQQEFMKEWLSLMESGSGERGIFNREGSLNNIPERRKKILSEEDSEKIGGNPCSEILLQSSQFCNLTSVVCRENDTEKTLLEKIRIATILGTYQSSLTNFSYLTKIWKDNCDKERLLGVSLNGQFDCPALRNENTFKKLKEQTIKVNQEYAKKFGINQSTAITCSKPEGTGSQMLNCSSGAHPRYSKYYIRRVRISVTDPLFKMFKNFGVPCHPEVGQTKENATTWVLEFPIMSPEKAITRNDLTAIGQLEYWKMIKTNYAEHTVSMTVYVGENEWIKVSDWIWDNWNIITGLSFLPKEDNNHVYKLAPYQQIDKNTYIDLGKKFPQIDFSKILEYEKEDMTQGAKEAGCVSGLCEII